LLTSDLVVILEIFIWTSSIMCIFVSQ
jgi:hypothetical protein